MAKYRKKPVVIEAFQWTGGPEQKEDPIWIAKAIEDGVVKIIKDPLLMSIETLEGRMYAHPGDYIIKGVKGELYPCKPDIFKLTYEDADKQQLGMYGETPEIRIGKYIISNFTIPVGGDLWIELEDGEGFQANKEQIEPYISQMFKDLF